MSRRSDSRLGSPQGYKASVEILSQADEATLRSVASVELAAWGRPAEATQVEARMRRLAGEVGAGKSDTKAVLVARDSGDVVGVCRVEQTEGNPEDWKFFGLPVHPKSRRRGVGRALLRASIGFARSHGARRIRSETHTDNQVSIDFHSAVGFVNDGCFTASDDDMKVAFSMVLSGPPDT